MVHRHSSKRNHRLQGTSARQRRRMVGLGSSVGAALAFGLSPLAVTPVARADIFDLLDPFIDPSGAVDPLAGLDLGLAVSGHGGALNPSPPPTPDGGDGGAGGTPGPGGTEGAPGKPGSDLTS